MGEKPKRHEYAHPKLGYRRWAHGVALIERLRPVLSLTQLSQRMDHPRGWADAARTDRQVMNETDVKKLEELVEELALEDQNTEDETVTGGRSRRCTPPEQAEFELVVEFLTDRARGTARKTKDQVGYLAGYASGSSLYEALRPGRRAGYDKLVSLRAYVSQHYGRGQLSSLQAQAYEEHDEESAELDAEMVVPSKNNARPPRDDDGDLDVLRVELLGIADRIKRYGEQYANRLAGAPRSTREGAIGDFKRKHDRLVEYIQEELE